jgi:hypothetical protein
MAGAAHDHVRGEMDIAEQVSTFEFFNGMTKWGSLGVGTLVLFLALWFCTGAGFGGAFITAVVVIALGVFFLREKPQAAGAH